MTMGRERSMSSVGGEQRGVLRKDKGEGGNGGTGNTETSLYQYGRERITAFCDRRTKRNKYKAGGAGE